MYSTIYSWSIDHIKSVFEAKSEDECLRAIDETFSHAIEVTVNGKVLSRMELQRFVLNMVGSSGYRLNVQWQNRTPSKFRETNPIGTAYWAGTISFETSASQDPLSSRDTSSLTLSSSQNL
ncbi:hypothetical protein EIP91_009004 [Steccherinum ochraceum]|uniref:Uncharacterized protein n=1 Tax=Steccherinum ochraceum TaxID=92696 RepID=A0A4R0RFF4_9APHY|nr:hypothetical protein EIP91_009004 [Steccherinum ochraceum]